MSFLNFHLHLRHFNPFGCLCSQLIIDYLLSQLQDHRYKNRFPLFFFFTFFVPPPQELVKIKWDAEQNAAKTENPARILSICPCPTRTACSSHLNTAIRSSQGQRHLRSIPY